MRLDQRQEGRLEQRQELRLTQQLIQKLELLQLPVLELQEIVEQELQENPTLELKEEGKEEKDGEAQTEPTSVTDAAAGENGSEAPAEPSAETEKIEVVDEWQEETFRTERRRATSGEESDKYQEMMQNIEAGATSLQDYLMRQVEMMDLPADTVRIVEVIVGQLDEDGLLRRAIRDDKGKLLSFQDVTLEEMADILQKEELFLQVPRDQLIEKIKNTLENIVQKLDPPGVATRSIKECLLVQLPEDTPFYDIKRMLIEQHLEDIAQNKLPKLCRELLKDPKFTETFNFNQYSDKDEVYDTVKTLISDINKLNPKPGQMYSPTRAINVVPEIEIKDVGNGEFEAILNDNYVPEIYVNETYKKILRDPGASREQKEFIRKKLANARALVEAIMHRRDLITKVARRVVDHQKDFFKYGVEHLKPLKMKTLAGEFGVHISTISRAVNSKYVQCPQGIFPLKFFFATAATRSNMGPVMYENEKKAKVTILDKLSEIIVNEDKRNPLSDEDIAKMLKDQGVTASRRAITKYRKELDIPSSKVRKQY
jgi:RNA polymerase sigma-54 factor